MYYSIFELFKIGIGPSSSHTVAPIKAANLFVKELLYSNNLKYLDKISITLQGSLAYTAIGHKTIDGIIIGLMGIKPEDVDTDSIYNRLKDIEKYLITKEGNFEGSNILVENNNELSEKEINISKEAEKILLDERSRRVKPFFDNKVQTDLNCYWFYTNLYSSLILIHE